MGIDMSNMRIPTAALDETLGPCFEFEFMLTRGDKDHGKQLVAVRVRIPVNGMVKVAERVAGQDDPIEGELLKVSAYVHTVVSCTTTETQVALPVRSVVVTSASDMSAEALDAGALGERKVVRDDNVQD